MESEEEIFEELRKAVIGIKLDDAKNWSKKSLEKGIDPSEAIEKGLAEGMKVIGEKYDKEEIYLPQVLLASDAMYAGLEILLPEIEISEEAAAPKKIVIGTVDGDPHDIGKNIVKAFLIAAGYNVIDLGREVPNNDFVEKADEEGADFVALSGLMTTTMPCMKEVIDLLTEHGIREALKVIIGGAPISREYARDIKADYYAKDQYEALAVLGGK